VAGLKAYADSVMKHTKQTTDGAVVEPRSLGEKRAVAEVSQQAAKCHKPRPVDGRQLHELVTLTVDL